MFKRKSLNSVAAFAVAALAVFALIFGIGGSKAVSAESSVTTVSEGFVYENGETKTKITGFELPATVEGDFEVVIPSGVKHIADSVFADLDSLRSVKLPEGLEIIDDYAFSMTSIEEITVPKTVKRIGEHAFHGCPLKTVSFGEGRTEQLAISTFAFASCKNIVTVRLPDNTTVGQYAFSDCTSLLWVYVGNSCVFKSSSGEADATATFFPVNTGITIIFPSKAAYDTMLEWKETTFKNKHLSASFYLVSVEFYVGASTEPMKYLRLNGKNFNFVPDSTGAWNTDTSFSVLPVQASHYASTTWYGESALTSAVSYDKLNTLLQTQSEIKLYSHGTIAAPTFPAEPVSWVYNSKTSYDINNLSEVLTALGCSTQYTEEQLSALQFDIVYADSDGKIADKPSAISENGVYSITLRLKPEYGVWVSPAASSITVNIDTSPFNIFLIILLIVGVGAVVITVVTAVIRKKVQARMRKKQISSQEAVERYNRIVGNS